MPFQVVIQETSQVANQASRSALWIVLQGSARKTRLSKWKQQTSDNMSVVDMLHFPTVSLEHKHGSACYDETTYRKLHTILYSEKQTFQQCVLFHAISAPNFRKIVLTLDLSWTILTCDDGSKEDRIVLLYHRWFCLLWCQFTVNEFWLYISMWRKRVEKQPLVYCFLCAFIG